jgi:hypothetical protein
MIKFLSIPLISYILHIPLVVILESFGGRGTVGQSSIEEYVILTHVLFFVYVINAFQQKRSRL